jgi:hypothetical protein
MRGVMMVVGVSISLSMGCATQKKAAIAISSGEPIEASADGSRYVDRELGFEVLRPAGAWHLDANSDLSPEGIAVPIVLRNEETGAQVVLQIAPAVISTSEYAERLSSGLRAQPGFLAGEPEPLPISEGAVGFDFEVGEGVRGKVAVVDGGEGQVFMLLATWPLFDPDSASEVEAIFVSVRPVPRG